jgi:hypothetical protein
MHRTRRVVPRLALALGALSRAPIAAADTPLPPQTIDTTESTPQAERAAYPWLKGDEPVRPLENAFPPPAGMRRVSLARDSFGTWLRRLPLRPAGSPVRAFDGSIVANAADPRIAAVSSLDVPPRDLQQCADSILRLHGEWLWSHGRAHEARYRFTSGDLASFADFANGERPEIQDRKVRFVVKAPRNDSYASFERFLEMVEQYAGTVSLAAYSTKVERADVKPGDFFVLPGGPGHAVLVLDIAERDGQRMLLLGQGYMPAEEFHVLAHDGAAWFSADGDTVKTPFWAAAFPWHSVRRLMA